MKVTSLERATAFLLSCVICCVAFANAALGASSQWQDIGGGKVRLLAVLDPGTLELNGAVEVKLKDGWSTYWRYPGSAGIPPMFDFSGSTGVELGPVEFPAPSLLGSEANPYAGYKKSVVFPFKGQVSDLSAPRIELQLMMGVCEDICIPAQAGFSLDSASLLRSDPAVTKIVSFARLKIPKPVDGSSLSLEITSKEQNALMISLSTPVGKTTPNLFVEGPPSWNLIPAKLVDQKNDRLVYSLNVSKAPSGTDFHATPLRFTLTTGSSGLEFSR